MLLYHSGKVDKVDSVRGPQDGEIVFAWLKNPSDQEIEAVVGRIFGCHELAVEDCKRTNQRPHLDLYDDHLYMPFYVLKENYELYEMAIVMGKNYVVAISPEETPFLTELVKSFERTPSKMKTSGMVLYELLDVCVEHYLDLVDSVEDAVDSMENRIQEDPNDKGVTTEMFQLKRKLHRVRRVFSEERNVLDNLRHCDEFFPNGEISYLADIAEHASRIVEEIDSFRDSLSGLHDMKMNNRADRMNDIMKKLTVVNTIFMPLAFITGLYGTNIKLPEYNWTHNYLWLWGLLAGSAIAATLFMKKKKYF